MEDRTFPISKLPHDVIVEILAWLPVKSLLKFKCFCKSWRAQISSQRFVAAHLENSKSDPNSTSQWLILESPRGNNLKQCSANSVLYDSVSEAFDLSWPVQSDSDGSLFVVDSCNGLICLAIQYVFLYSRIAEKQHHIPTELFLWNPSTRILKELPDYCVEVKRYSSYFLYGFGYDKSSDDYKVVGLFDENDYGSNKMNQAMVKVYSLRNDEWRKVKSFERCDLELLNPATFVNGKLYWITECSCQSEDEVDWYVVCLDLGTEEHDVLQLPGSITSCLGRRLGDSGGSLMMMCGLVCSIEVWIMDAGNEDWTKVVTIPYVEDYWCRPELAWRVMNNGPILFLCAGTIVVFDAKDGSIRYPEIRNSRGFGVCGTYIESLVSPLG